MRVNVLAKKISEMKEEEILALPVDVIMLEAARCLKASYSEMVPANITAAAAKSGALFALAAAKSTIEANEFSSEQNYEGLLPDIPRPNKRG
jgi:hypothetical protein